MQWIEHDEVETLPRWARLPGEVLDGHPYDVVVHAEGVVLSRARRTSALRWHEVLVPVRLDDPRRLLLTAPRRPPRPPWFELCGKDVARIERAVRIGLEARDDGGYRVRGPARDVVPPDVVLTRVLERAPLPGAVEIPAATPSVLRSALAGAAFGGATFGFYGLVLGPAGLLAGGAVGAIGGASLLGGLEHARKRSAGRVLVLTPDAFVAGLDGHSVRAVPWFRVGRFADGVAETGESALEVFGPRDDLLARVAARFFGKPLDVIVAVAEAYRRRAAEE